MNCKKVLLVVGEMNCVIIIYEQGVGMIMFEEEMCRRYKIIDFGWSVEVEGAKINRIAL